MVRHGPPCTSLSAGGLGWTMRRLRGHQCPAVSLPAQGGSLSGAVCRPDQSPPSPPTSSPHHSLGHVLRDAQTADCSGPNLQGLGSRSDLPGPSSATLSGPAQPSAALVWSPSGTHANLRGRNRDHGCGGSLVRGPPRHRQNPVASRLLRPDPDPALAVHGSGQQNEVLPRSRRDPADCTIAGPQRNTGMRCEFPAGIEFANGDAPGVRLIRLRVAP
jgi:hypothetical protein